MIEATRLAHHAALRLRTRHQGPWHLPHVAWASSLSAIHRGIHRGNGTGRRDAKSQKTARGRQKAVAGKSGEFTGKMTRRKRFIDPNSPFGKHSHVYRVKYGDLKEKAEAILARDEEKQAAIQAAVNGGAGSGAESRAMDNGGQNREEAPARERTRAREDASDPGARGQAPRENEMARGKPKSGKRREPISLPRATAASQFLFGTPVINAALGARRRKLYRLYVLNTGKRAQEIQDQQNNPQILAKKCGVPVTFVEPQRAAMLDKMSGGRPHNGYILEASPLPQLPVKSLGPCSAPHSKPTFEVVLGRQSKEEEAVNGTDPRIPYRRGKQRKPFVVLLHEVVDPGNLGAMIRSAAFLGASAVAITAGGSATLTPVAAKAAAGAAEEIPVLVVGSDMDFIEASKKAGWRFYATAPPSAQKNPRKTTAAEIEKDDPLAEAPCVLVLGSEGHGLPKKLRRAANFEISIPGASRTSVDSLNVSVAGGILCNAFLNPSTAQPDKTESQEALSSDEPAEEIEEDNQQSDQVTPSEGSAGQEQRGKGGPEEKQTAADDEERIF